MRRNASLSRTERQLHQHVTQELEILGATENIDATYEYVLASISLSAWPVRLGVHSALTLSWALGNVSFRSKRSSGSAPITDHKPPVYSSFPVISQGLQVIRGLVHISASAEVFSP